MTINTYAGVKDYVAAVMNRADLTARIPDFISMAEARLNRILADNVNLVKKCRIGFSIQSRCVPDDFNGVVTLSYDVQDGGALRYKTASEMVDFAPTASSIPRYYTIVAGQFLIWPYPSDETITLTLRYRQKLDAVSLGSNWLLENHPDAYIYGALVQATTYMIDDDRVGLWQSQFDATMNEINRQAQDITFGGPLQVKSCGGE